MATLQTRLSRRTGNFFHEHVLFVPAITQHAANIFNVIRREFEVRTVLSIALRPMSRVVRIDFNRRVTVQVASQNRQLAYFLGRA
jgi:hypothetical protein